MPKSSPADLAVTFRSIARRLREARGEAPASAVAPLEAQVDGHVRAAAGLVHSSADAESVAAAILERPADDWDEADLDALRANALEIGKVLRAVESLAAEHDR
jgi:shikimate kinase